MRSLRVFLVIICLSISILGFCTIVSYFLYKENKTNFKIGWPFYFFYQFAVRTETGYEIQHGTLVKNFIYDCILSFTFMIIIFLIFKRTRTYLTSLFV